MNLENLYREMKSKGIKVSSQDLILAIENSINNLKSDDLQFVFLLIGPEMSDQVFDEIHKILEDLDLDNKKILFNILSNLIGLINIEAAVNCFSVEDYEIGFDFFSLVFKAESISCIDKYILFDELLESSISSSTLETYTMLVLEVAETVLLNPKSFKGEVRQSVSTLRRIEEQWSEKFPIADLLGRCYKFNVLWRHLYNEEVEYRHKVLQSSFDAKVSQAFRDKDYQRVVNLIGKYESELPDPMKKKLDISRNKLKNKNSGTPTR